MSGDGSSRLLLWVPLVALLVIVCWGLVSWFVIGIKEAGVLGDAMSPVTALLTAFALAAALYSLESQRSDISTRLAALEDKKKSDEERKKWEAFIARVEQVDLHRHDAKDCPWCDMKEHASSFLVDDDS